MQKTKIIIALVALATLTLVVIGWASAQIAANQTSVATGQNQVPNNGFLGGIGNCFDYSVNQAYGSQYVEPQPPTEDSSPEPYQGGFNYGYGYGYGPCWIR